MADIPVISIVTPSFNQGDFLEETLVSVLSQKGDFVLDYIVVDGGSTDSSPEIIRSYADRLNRNEWPVHCRGINFRWMSEPDDGQTDALAKGFAMAEGDILGWLNSDDNFLPETLQTVANFWQGNPEDVLFYGDAYYTDTTGEKVGLYPTEDFDLNKLSWSNFFCQPSTFFGKKAFEEVGGLDISLHYGMDYDLFVRLSKRFGCVRIPKFLSCYRLHLDSKTMRDETLYASHTEALQLARRHFNYAPLNLVYGASYYYCLKRIPESLTRVRLPYILSAVFFAVLRTVWMNKGIRRNDLKILSFSNMKKLFKKREGILLGDHRQ